LLLLQTSLSSRFNLILLFFFKNTLDLAADVILILKGVFLDLPKILVFLLLGLFQHLQAVVRNQEGLAQHLLYLFVAHLVHVQLVVAFLRNCRSFIFAWFFAFGHGHDVLVLQSFFIEDSLSTFVGTLHAGLNSSFFSQNSLVVLYQFVDYFFLCLIYFAFYHIVNEVFSPYSIALFRYKPSMLSLEFAFNPCLFIFTLEFLMDPQNVIVNNCIGIY
jgi:hypothetical protein